jgi:hypothetical protein
MGQVFLGVSPGGRKVAVLAIADGDGNIYVRVTSQFMP